MIIEQNVVDDRQRFLLDKDFPFFQSEPRFLSFWSCPNPTCDCGEGNLYVQTAEQLEQKVAPFGVALNVKHQTIQPQLNLAEVAPSDYYEALEAVKRAFTAEDWEKLSLEYRENKVAQVESAQPSEIECEFSEEHFKEVSAMVQYAEIFSPAYFEIKLIQNEAVYQYEVIDAYCKDKACGCSDIALEVGEINEKGEWANLGHYEYNYDTKKGDIKANTKAEEAVSTKVIEQLFAEIPNLDNLLAHRNNMVRVLFEKAKAKRLAAMEVPAVEKAVKVGRNEPCPCGSGKKYKKCCG